MLQPWEVASPPPGSPGGLRAHGGPIQRCQQPLDPRGPAFQLGPGFGSGPLSISQVAPLPRPQSRRGGRQCFAPDPGQGTGQGGEWPLDAFGGGEGFGLRTTRACCWALRGRAGRGRCGLLPAGPGHSLQPPFQSPTVYCVSLNKTNPFGGVTSPKNAAVFHTTRANMFFRFGFYGRIKVYFP